ncbi:hypothetical protein CHELA20_11441 [Hyphomicrobiales bacterium]|nr:hypothetical protein CHELA20_11441 [Hyphomicrobiales bacterium]
MPDVVIGASSRLFSTYLDIFAKFSRQVGGDPRVRRRVRYQLFK